MKRLFSIVATLLLLTSCGGGYNPPDDPVNGDNSGNNNSGNNTKYSVADFSFETYHPLCVKFTNLSSNANRYTWHFGDGEISNEKNPIHRYAKKGVYEVRLYAEGYGTVSDTKKKTVTITEPTKCFVTGVVYNDVPEYNEYYNLRFTDDYILFETLYWYTDWSLISSANLPFTDDFTNKQQIDFSKSEYVVRLYKNSKPSGKGTQVENWSIFPSDLKKSFDEKIKKVHGKSSITLNLEWKD